MPNEPPDPETVNALRKIIEAFIEMRLEPKRKDLEKKLENEDNFDKRDSLSKELRVLLAKYQRETWLEDAAIRAGQLQVVTHAIKYTYPIKHAPLDAKASNIYQPESSSSEKDAWVGTHTLGRAYSDDVVGNAAALDVYKFLKLEYEGQSLLNRILARDLAVSAAFSDRQEEANRWMEQFAEITGNNKLPTSHTLAKQVYFPLQSGDYHLLAPLFPTSLVHTVYQHLQEVRFSEATKEAKQARKEWKSHPNGYREYPKLLVQSFGGTKPQNISQLNSERGGKNTLLPSFPPTWYSAPVRLPLGITTVFGRWFGSRPVVRELTRGLANFLTSTRHNTVHIRHARASLVERIGDELWQFSAEIYQLPSGWSDTPECRLDQTEALWLDPGREESDESFAAQRRRGDWQEEVASRFGNWLNQQLIYHSKRNNNDLPMGEVEHNEWKSQIAPVLASIHKELAHE